jgi:hypothetical protein
MTLFLVLLGLWMSAILAVKYIITAWRRQRVHQPARQLKEIVSVDYFRRLSPAQFESLITQGIKAHQFTLLGDPFLGRSTERRHKDRRSIQRRSARRGIKERRSKQLRSQKQSPRGQGYAWKNGKKTIVAYRLERPLLVAELDDIVRKVRTARAERVLVFSPFSKVTKSRHDGVELLYGKKLVHWFSVIGEISPPLTGRVLPEACDCGEPMRERISRVGRPLLVCSRFPDCRTIRQATESLEATQHPASAKLNQTAQQANPNSV